jgi:hypothetical protein
MKRGLAPLPPTTLDRGNSHAFVTVYKVKIRYADCHELQLYHAVV